MLSSEWKLSDRISIESASFSLRFEDVSLQNEVLLVLWKDSMANWEKPMAQNIFSLSFSLILHYFFHLSFSLRIHVVCVSDQDLCHWKLFENRNRTNRCEHNTECSEVISAKSTKPFLEKLHVLYWKKYEKSLLS